MRRLYIAGPYSADPEACTLRAIDAFHAVLDLGLYPFLPHFTHYAHLRRPRPYEDWMALDFGWLDACHALLRLPGMSPGADREVARANEMGIPVFTNMEEVAAWAGQ